MAFQPNKYTLGLLALTLGTMSLLPLSAGTGAAPRQAEPLAQLAVLQDGPGLTPEERREKQRQIAEERRKQREAEDAKNRELVEGLYAEFELAYLTNDMDKLDELYKQMRPKQRLLPREKQQAIRHINRMAPTYRPKWWKGTKKQQENSFKAEIWGRKFMANYVPSRELGLQAVYPQEEYNRRTGQFEVTDLIVLVSWKPLMVDNPDAAGGELAEMHDYKLGDLAEVIVWHELGHNYLTEAISTKNNIELYTRYADLYSTMHEYFADMAAIYHGTPKARKLAIQFRLEELDYYTQDSSHCRGAHGIGAIILHDMLQAPTPGRA